MTDEKRVKTTKVRFNFFKKCFLEYADRFGLLGWDIGYKIEDLGDTLLASLTYRANERVGTLRLNTSMPKGDDDIRETAKHEAVHLLLGEYDHIASCRFCSPEELIRANEEVTVKLTKLIP